MPVLGACGVSSELTPVSPDKVLVPVRHNADRTGYGHKPILAINGISCTINKYVTRSPDLDYILRVPNLNITSKE